MREPVFVLVLLAALSASACHAEGLGTLIQVGKSMDEVQRDYDRDTATYGRVKTAIEKGEIKKGLTQATLLKYGEPVAIVTEAGKNRRIWVYRPGTTDLLNKPKIRLFFDGSGTLDEIAVLE